MGLRLRQKLVSRKRIFTFGATSPTRAWYDLRPMLLPRRLAMWSTAQWGRDQCRILAQELQAVAGALWSRRLCGL